MPTLESAPTKSVSVPTVELTRIVRTSRARVYEAWTNPEDLKTWFGPDNMHCSTVELDPQPGGAYIIAVRRNDADPSEPDAAASGNYTKVVPDQLLQFTWKPTWNPSEESLVTVSFKDVADGTQINIRHENCEADACERYANGWNGCLDKMQVVLAD
jgi:uncharacterized protein YndB with AHSA1/START domain